MGSLRKPRTISDSSAATLARLLAARGLSEGEIDRGLEFVMDSGIIGMRGAYELAVSRIQYTDEQLAAGMRFRAVDEEHS